MGHHNVPAPASVQELTDFPKLDAAVEQRVRAFWRDGADRIQKLVMKDVAGGKVDTQLVDGHLTQEVRKLVKERLDTARYLELGGGSEQPNHVPEGEAAFVRIQRAGSLGSVALMRTTINGHERQIAVPADRNGGRFPTKVGERVRVVVLKDEPRVLGDVVGQLVW